MVINLKKYVWIIPYFGMCLCWFALPFPAAYFENVFYNHHAVVWMWGFFEDTLIRYNTQVISSFYNYPLQINTSIIGSFINLISLIFLFTLLVVKRKQLKDGELKLTKYIVLSSIIIISSMIWMVSMEISEQLIYDLSFWGRYVPGFGLIGILLGAGLIIIGIILTKVVKNHNLTEF